jgi:hypothetical protein
MDSHGWMDEVIKLRTDSETYLYDPYRNCLAIIGHQMDRPERSCPYKGVSPQTLGCTTLFRMLNTVRYSPCEDGIMLPESPVHFISGLRGPDNSR